MTALQYKKGFYKVYDNVFLFFSLNTIQTVTEHFLLLGLALNSCLDQSALQIHVGGSAQCKLAAAKNSFAPV